MERGPLTEGSAGRALGVSSALTALASRVCLLTLPRTFARERKPDSRTHSPHGPPRQSVNLFAQTAPGHRPATSVPDNRSQTEHMSYLVLVDDSGRYGHGPAGYSARWQG